MAENSSELAKTHRFKKLNKLQRGTPKENLCQDTLQLNFCKIKTMKNLESIKRKMTLCLQGENNWNEGFLIRIHRARKELAQSFSSAETKELSTQNPLPNENILQK